MCYSLSVAFFSESECLPTVSVFLATGSAAKRYKLIDTSLASSADIPAVFYFAQVPPMTNEYMDVLNPANGKVIARVPVSGPQV